MRAIGALALAAVAALAAAPAASAEESGSVAVADACGDNNAYLARNDVRVDLPPTDRTPRFDLKRIEVSSVPGGVSVRFETCSPIGAPDGFKGFRAAYFWLSDDCQLAVGVEEPALPIQPRQPVLAKTCWVEEDRNPLPNVSDHSDPRFRIDLPADAATVEEGALVVTVARAGLTGEAAATLAPGVRWDSPFALSQENATLMGFGGDSEGNSHSFVAPTGLDWAAGDQPFVVG